MSQLADALAVHGEECGIGGRNYIVTLFLKLYKLRGGNGLYLRNDHIRFLLFNNLAQTCTVKH